MLEDDGLAAFRAVLESRIPKTDDEKERGLRRSITAELERVFESIVASASPALVVEVGANEASFSKRMKRRFPDARVVAFEANPEVYSRYLPQVSAAGIEYHHCCVSDREGEVELSVPIREGKAMTTMGSVLLDRRAVEHQRYHVPARKLDSMIGQVNPGGLVIWIDVEGAVPQVIEGASTCLASALAVYVELESKPRWIGQAIDSDIIRKLGDYGLFPFLCDVQRDFQYNLIMLRRGAFPVESLAAQRNKFSKLAADMVSWDRNEIASSSSRR